MVDGIQNSELKNKNNLKTIELENGQTKDRNSQFTLLFEAKRHNHGENVKKILPIAFDDKPKWTKYICFLFFLFSKLLFCWMHCNGKWVKLQGHTLEFTSISIQFAVFVSSLVPHVRRVPLSCDNLLTIQFRAYSYTKDEFGQQRRSNEFVGVFFLPTLLPSHDNKINNNNNTGHKPGHAFVPSHSLTCCIYIFSVSHEHWTLIKIKKYSERIVSSSMQSRSKSGGSECMKDLCILQPELTLWSQS